MENNNWETAWHNPINEKEDNKILILQYGTSKERNGSGTHIIAEVKTNLGFNYNHEEAEANAKLIATSVNNHSKLIEALKEIRLAGMEIDDIPFWKKHSEKFAKAFELLQSIEQQAK